MIGVNGSVTTVLDQNLEAPWNREIWNLETRHFEEKFVHLLMIYLSFGCLE